MNEDSPTKKQSKNDKKALLNNLNQAINPIMKQLDQEHQSLQMPELALRCAQFFHSISEYCVGYYRNYVKEEETKKTKLIKKMEKDKEQKVGRRGRKKQNKDVQESKNESKLQPPKKPLTAYIIYFQDKKPQFVERYTSLNLSELTKLIAKQWKELSESEKQVYLDRAADDRKRYQEQLAEFKLLYGKNADEIDLKDSVMEEQDLENIVMEEQPQKSKSRQPEEDEKGGQQSDGDHESEEGQGQMDAEGEGQPEGQADESESEGEQNERGASEEESEGESPGQSESEKSGQQAD